MSPTCWKIPPCRSRFFCEASIFMRNLKSKSSRKIGKVPRDQPFLPVFLEKQHLNAEIITVSNADLEQELGFKSIDLFPHLGD